MKKHIFSIPGRSIAVSALMLMATSSGTAQILQTAGSYGVLAGSTVTNTGNTVINGDLGVWPGTAITGFDGVDAGGPGLVIGTVNQANAAAELAQTHLTEAYVYLAGLSPILNLSGQDLGGMTLTPGVYFFSSSAQLTGTLTLDALNDPLAQFVFQIGSTLTAASNSLVSIININPIGDIDSGLFWQVGSSATIGTDSTFAGNIVALTSITLNTGASLDYGRALAINGAVTLESNWINTGNTYGGFADLTPIPEPGTYGLIGTCVLLCAAFWRRRKSLRASRA
jgi:type VI secretion system secreted protein VgrG